MCSKTNKYHTYYKNVIIFILITALIFQSILIFQIIQYLDLVVQSLNILIIKSNIDNLQVNELTTVTADVLDFIKKNPEKALLSMFIVLLTLWGT